MNKHAIASEYGAFLREARELAVFFSGRNWNAGSEHDPGLTQLEILTNALALVCERYDQAFAEGGLFVAPGSGTGWATGPDSADMFFLANDANLPEAEEFHAEPAVREDLCRDMESLAGLRRVWIVRRDETSGPEMLVEFAPVLDMRGEAFALNGQSADAAHILKRKREILEEAADRCRRLRGAGQPALGVREVRLTPLQAEINAILPDMPERAKLPALAADLLLAADDYLRPRYEPRSAAVPRELAACLAARLSEKGADNVSVTVRLSAASGNASGGYDEQRLASGDDAFAVSHWQIGISSGASLLELSAREIRKAEYLARLALAAESRMAVAAARPEKPFPPDLREPKLHEQFPELYKAAGENIDDPVRWGEVRQFQGWLLLFEQLLADALHLLRNSPALFAAGATRPENWFAARGGALQKLLTDETAYKAGILEAAEAGGFAARCCDLLLHLAALQGEEPWCGRERIAEEDSRWPEILACWLRHLPWLNGRRMSAAMWPEYSDSGLSPLEARLTMLLLLYGKRLPLAARQFFDIRVVRDALTGRDEYRCYIRDADRALRIVCLLVGRSPEEAARAGMMALSFARLPEHYHRTATGVTIAWVAVLADAAGGAADDERIRETAAWAASLLPPWLRVLEYPILGETHPFEALVLLEEEAVPAEMRDELRERISAHMPAHVLPHVAFLSREERRKADMLLYASTRAVRINDELARFCEEKISGTPDT